MGASAEWEKVGRLEDEIARHLSVEQDLQKACELVDLTAQALCQRGRARVDDIERLVQVREEVREAVSYLRDCRMKMLANHPCKRS